MFVARVSVFNMPDSKASAHVYREAYFATRALLPDGPMRLETLAAELGVAPRTLQRRLSEEGLSFSDLIREVQLEVACRLLADSSLSVQEISSRVGFVTPASFSRAFHAWTGKCPRDYRRQIGLAQQQYIDN